MRACFIFLCPLVFLFMASHVSAQSAPRKKINSIDDLPRHTYTIAGTLIELINDDTAFDLFAAEVRNNINNDLQKYQIEDKTTLKDFYEVLININILFNDNKEALKQIARTRELEDKPARILTNNLINEAIIKARIKARNNSDAKYRKKFSKYLSRSLEKLPWDVISERLNKIKSDIEIFSENVIIGMIQSQYEPAVEQNNQIGNNIAVEIINARFLIEIVLPLKEEIIEVMNRYIAANRVEKKDIWEARKANLSIDQDLQPVNITIWDTGVDINLFSDQLFMNLSEMMNDKDDDNNGYIDDIHGIAYTLECDKTPQLIYPIAYPERIGELKEIIKGFNDLESSIDSPEASALKQKLADMDPADIKPFIEEITQFAFYMHGTYTASLALEGNPFARLLPVRMTVDYRIKPAPPTVEATLKTAKMYEEIIDYLKTHHVRVVNMSWHNAVRYTEQALEVNGIGRDAEERARLARELFDVEKEAMYKAMKNASGVLFISSAGNSNENVAFEDYYPSSFDLPNLLVVGAVDQAGTETGFTSFGSNVDIYANGYEVEGMIPGGDRLPASGTSASSPIVANLAAKLIALDPSLTPPEVINLIKQGADPSEDGRLLLINPKRTIELVRSP